MATTIFGFPELESAQNQKYLTVNQALQRIDAMVNLTVFNRTVTAPPGSPGEGHRYIVAATATGAFAGQETKVAVYIGSNWIFFTPSEGWRAYDQGANEHITFNGTAWVVDGVSSGSLSNGSIELLGVNATPDSTNRLSVSAPGVLFNRETDDFTLTLNKDAAGDDLAVLMQTGFSTRMQMGLLANDDFAIRVSPDGSSFFTGITIDKDTGNVAIGAGSDANNKLLVAGASALFTNSSGGFSFVFSKNATGDDASITFQTNFSGRALIGLLGSDDFAFTVSPDGSTYTQAMLIDKDDARVSFPQHPKFSGYCNYDQYSAADAWFTLDINNLDHNDQSAVASGVFTAPHDGIYIFGGGMRHLTNGTVPTSILFGLSIDNANPLPRHTQVAGEGGAAIDDTTSLAVTACLSLTAGQTVRLKAFFTAQDAYSDADYNYFWGAQIA